MTPRPISAILLVAGEGSRMHSPVPKPLHRLCGRPMVIHMLDALAELPMDRVVLVVGHGALDVQRVVNAEAPTHLKIEFVEQVAQLGTGDATAVGLTGFPPTADLDEGDVVVLPADMPLVRPATLAALVRHHRERDAAATLLTARIADPTGYGRIVRGKDGDVARVVEHADATEDEREIDEINTSIYCFRHSVLAPALRRLSPNNAQGEYYLTDAIEVLASAGYPVVSMVVADPTEAAGVNDRAQLAAAEAEVRGRINERWMRRGVTMTDPDATYIATGVEIAEDVTILPGTILEGSTVVGRGAVVGPHTRLIDSEVGPGAIVEQSTAIGATIGELAVVGPYVVLSRGDAVGPGDRLGAQGRPVGSDRTESERGS
jgi:bifunctional UDP-N-acetylglucosamine pyrophosphorylase/glucosamine-1-phosphate N-acetyltransferase